MDKIRCFMVEPTDRVVLSLRRYTGPGCYGPGSFGIHTATAPLGEAAAILENGVLQVRPERDQIPDDDPRWPQKCHFCDHRFADHPYNALVDQEPIYRRADTGETFPLRNAPPGAMWYAHWMGVDWAGPDGRSLYCMVPGGEGKVYEWCIDGMANNCTKPKDREHRCWVRTGTPPNVTAGKGGNTCSAGAGSILVPGWHGYLIDGFLVKA